jgi:hypothetical protein
MVERTQRRRDEEKRKAVWPTTIIRQSLSGSTGAMETHPPCIMYVCMYLFPRIFSIKYVCA